MYLEEQENNAFESFIEKTDAMIKCLHKNKIPIKLKDNERWFLEEALKITQLQRKFINTLVNEVGYEENLSSSLIQVDDQLRMIGNIIAAA